MEVKESRMIPSNARQLLRPSRSFSFTDGQRRVGNVGDVMYLEVLELMLICG